MILDAVGQTIELGDFAATAGPGKHFIMGVVVDILAGNLIKIRYKSVGRRWRYDPNTRLGAYTNNTNNRHVIAASDVVLRFTPNGQTQFRLTHPYWIKYGENNQFRTEVEATLPAYYYELQTAMKLKLNEQNEKANT